jgi:hypothetical protein
MRFPFACWLVLAVPVAAQDGKTDAERGGGEPLAAPEADRPPDGGQRSGQLPPADATGDFLRHDLDARWGVLPPKLQERLMNLHVDDVPQRHRLWLEACVRELNRRDQGANP